MRWTALVALILASTLLFCGRPAAAAGPAEFKLGFKKLADLLPDVVGAPLEDEHFDPTGDSLQTTTKGLLVWRRADNWTAFTNGSRTWVNGPFGVVDRENDLRFEWEADRVVGSTQIARALPPGPAAVVLAASPSDLFSAAEMAALDMLNRGRVENGVPPVVMDERLRQVARAHAEDMATRRYFAHNTPEGLSPFDRMKSAGIQFKAAAENIGYSFGYPSPTAGIQANHLGMMAEVPPNDGHRKNILNGRFGRVGIGVHQAEDGKIYYVCDFMD